MKKLIETIHDFWKYTIGYKYNDLMYIYWRVPKFKLKLMFHYLKDSEIMSWDMVNCHELIFGMYIMFFEENEEHLKPWLEDGKWQEHKHSENWEGTPKGEGSGLKYKEMLEIYIYIKFIRNENEKICADLLHALFSDENYKTWWEDSDEVYNGEKCSKHCNERLKNFKIEYKFSKNSVLDSMIYSLEKLSQTSAKKLIYKKHNLKELCADNLKIKITELKTVSSKYNKDFDTLHEIEEAIIEKDNVYAKRILEIRGYLWC